ncbi:restriction endonuclease subunit S [uncultured Brachyspira sp.]|uniref:restriction endonuclease subunit S n=1 Tax=uncultured Brachyspira sp. TaxID=221953 RepID=UPI00261C7D24|nr:restriction endonuclease subunit S [uncultured Brachyspira sp.]
MKNTHLPTGWQEVKLGDIATIIKVKNKENKNYPVLSNSAIYGVVLQEEYFYKKIASKNDTTNYYIVDIGNFIYNPRISENAPAGPINVNKLTKGIVSPLYTVFYVKKEYSDFIAFYLSSSLWVNYLKEIANYGARYDRLGINDKMLLSIPILLPPLEEQKRIAEVLSLCDDIIENLTELIDKKEQYKKGVMQRLLSGEVRFKGFTDEWQTVRLGDILSYEQPNNYIVKNDEYNNKYECPVLTAGKTFVLGYTNEKFGIYNEIPVIIFDDFTTETKYVNFPFKVKSSAIKILSSNKCNLKLIYELIKMIKFNAESHKRYWISEYQYLEIKIPKSIEEQKKIAGLLSLIDEDIENLKKQLELRKQQKKGLMQRLLTGEVRI